ncbi:MAG TPA: hypothetical protein DCS13_06025 [Candidatus Margulisbacteria bacterium]|nr:hypothetical protein [Candidatus Margulisiibacteriota bacterium]HCY35825.1 hypothetical protein [Candidatus Margulisiibacteriota bacterium]
MGNDQDDIIEIFIAEGKESLDEVESILLRVQKIENCKFTDIKDDINSIFRYFHSIKGTASFLDLSSIVEVSHEAETLLDLLRKKEDDTILTEDISSVLFKTVDVLSALINLVMQTSDDEDIEDKKATVLEQLKTMIHYVREGVPTSVPKAAIPELVFDFNDEDLISPEIAAKFSQESVEIIDKVEESLLCIIKQSGADQESAISEAFRNIHSFKGNCGFMQISQLEKLSHLMENYLDGLRIKDISVSDDLIKTMLNMVDYIREALAEYAKGNKILDNFEILYGLFTDELKLSAGIALPASQHQADTKTLKGKETIIIQAPEEKVRKKEREDIGLEKKQLEKKDIRVDITKLDNLINLVGELVIAQSMVLINPILIEADDENLERSVHHLNRISSDLQDVAMSVRMVPLSMVFKKMVRLVYDLSKKSNKKADIELIGEETEVDRNIIEQINDPLVHIIRNAIDHGLETPEARVAAGKPEEGKITIEARHEGGEVWIIIKDDGRGLDREKILEKAIEKGLIPKNFHLAEEQIFNLIFEPGFSTADKITDISGRGVGMDVVKKNIEKLKGTINVHSTQGQGSDIILRIPLTLAIIDGMLVRVGSTYYTIPLLSIQESIKIESQKVTVTPDGQETILIRKEHVPIIRLYKYFKKNADKIDLKGSVLVICETGRQKMALLVDDIVGQQQTVIKSLPEYFVNMKGVSGCTIMGNGEISLIIDINSLAQIAREKINNKQLIEVKK